MKSKLKALLPHLLVIIGFYVISIAYFPENFTNKSLQQSDVSNWRGGAKEILDYSNYYNEQTLWTNSSFCGGPAFGVSVQYPNNKAKYVANVLNPLQLKYPAVRLFWAMLGFYFLFLIFRINPLLAFAGALGFAFSSYFFIVESVGHNAKSMAIAYIPYLVASMLLVFRNRKYILGGALFGLFVAVQVGFGHPQIFYYTLFIFAAIAITYLVFAIKEKEYKHISISATILAIAFVLGVGCNFGQLYNNYKYSKQTMRGGSELTINDNGTAKHTNVTTGLDRDYITAWSYGKFETLNLMIPRLVGGGSGEALDANSESYKYINDKYGEDAAKQVCEQAPLYWGPQPFTEGPVYIGAILVFLFVLGLFVVRRQTLWWIIGATVLAIVLAWGKYFSVVTDLFIDYFPFYNKFRTVSMILVIVEFTIPLLAILGLSKIIEKQRDLNVSSKALLKATAITGGICLFLVLFAGFFDCSGLNDSSIIAQYNQFGLNGAEFMEKIKLDRQSLMRMDSLRSLLFILLMSGTIYLFLQNKIKNKYIVYGFLATMILADMWSIDKKYLSSKNFQEPEIVQNPFTPQDYDMKILNNELADQVLYEKVMNNVTAQLTKKDLLNDENEKALRMFSELNLNTNYRVLNYAVNTFNDASTSYLHKSVGGYSAVKLGRIQDLWDFHISKQNMSVINMLNVKYIVFNNNGKPDVIPNPDRLGNAWFVSGYKTVNNPNEEILALTKFNPRDTAIVNKEFVNDIKQASFKKDTASKIVMDEYRPNRLTYTSTSSAEQLAVFSEVYYAGDWHATIDGKEAKIIRVNYVLRAMVVPAGKHSIKFEFHPDSYYIGNKVSLISSLILILLSIGAIGFEGWRFFRKQ